MNGPSVAEKWWAGHMTGLDTETTGTNPHEVRIITAAIVQDETWLTSSSTRVHSIARAQNLILRFGKALLIAAAVISASTAAA